MRFREYHRNAYLVDIATLRRWAEASPVAHREDFGGIFAIQPSLLEQNREELKSWSRERLALCSVGLYLNTLVDQVAYTHLSEVYDQFQQHTRYPKLRGNCPGFCGTRHPMEIFGMVIQWAEVDSVDFGRAWNDLLEDAVAVCRDEVHDCLEKHMPSVIADRFWTECYSELPFRFQESEKLRGRLRG